MREKAKAYYPRATGDTLNRKIQLLENKMMEIRCTMKAARKSTATV